MIGNSKEREENRVNTRERERAGYRKRGYKRERRVSVCVCVFVCQLKRQGEKSKNVRE
jgi:hypothetical protein